MPITQIPFQAPPPPQKPEPEQLGLYDSTDWETAYRELDERVPHLLIQLQDDLQRSRKREAAWISVIVHLLLFMFLVYLPWIEKNVWHRGVVVAVDSTKNKNLTYLTLPPDLQKVPRKPKTNVMSDKDRTSMSRNPDVNAKRILTPPPGAPGMRGRHNAPPALAPPQTMAQNPPTTQPPQPQPQPQQSQSSPRPQFQTDQNQTARLQTPPPNPANVFNKYAGGASAGEAIQQATEAAAARRSGGGGGDEGNFGLERGARGREYGAMEILSDTQGVDFGPYLQRILEDVRQNWYRLIPESAEMKKGKLALEFAIMKDGHVQALRVVAPSGDVTLDRPAYGSITASDPFPPLPGNFTGPYLELRFRFYYNPDKGEIE